jgi:hypothetical protein
VGAEANQKSRSGEKNCDIIRETNRHPEEICRADEETNITGEEAIGDGEEPKVQVDT